MTALYYGYRGLKWSISGPRQVAEKTESPTCVRAENGSLTARRLTAAAQCGNSKVFAPSLEGNKDLFVFASLSCRPHASNEGFVADLAVGTLGFALTVINALYL